MDQLAQRKDALPPPDSPQIAPRLTVELVGWALAIPILTMLYAIHGYPGPGGRIWFGDSVSFQYSAISHSLGHPPGYPQYLALIRGVALVPLGQAWQRVNFVSSFFAALALGAEYALCRQIGFSRWAGCAAALVLGVSWTFYVQATEAEVYSLHVFWVLCCLVAFVLYLATNRFQVLLVFFAIYGCALGHHPMMVLLVLPVAITALCYRPHLFADWRVYGAAVMAIAIGLAQYVYTYNLFIDSTLSFRFVDYPERNLSHFIDFTTGAGFKKAMFSEPLGTVLQEKVPKLLRLAHAQNYFVFPLLGVIGSAFARQPACIRLLLLLSMFAHVIWALVYNVGDIEAFCTPLWALCYIGVIPGLQVLVRRRMPGITLGMVATGCALAFRHAVIDTGNYRPENYRLALVEELLTHMPADSKLLTFRIENNSAVPSLLRYLEASGDRGQFRVLNRVKRCEPGIYFMESSRKLIRVRNYRAQRIARIERAQQDLFVMQCASPK